MSCFVDRGFIDKRLDIDTVITVITVNLQMFLFYKYNEKESIYQNS